MPPQLAVILNHGRDVRFWPKRTFCDVRHMAAFEGKADICSIKTSWTAAKAPKAAQA
jgi:hypothetical protein